MVPGAHVSIRSMIGTAFLFAGSWKLLIWVDLPPSDSCKILLVNTTKKDHTCLGIGPCNDILLLDGFAITSELGEEGQGVGAHQLPHNCKDQLLVSLLQVGT